jgi:Na+-translocating ferredoxin:NAD+ oxidoreductase RnfG subunit
MTDGKGSERNRTKLYIRRALIAGVAGVLVAVASLLFDNHLQQRKQQAHAHVVERCLKESKEQTPDIIKKCNDVASAIYSK